MTTYNFDEIIPRRGSGSYKWDTPERDDILPLWVADMDFRTAPAIVEALRRRVDHGIFGYTKVPDAYYESVVNWFGTRHHWQISPDWFIYTSGVVPAISAIIKAMTSPGDEVIVQTPAYNCFFSSIRNNDCILSANNLIYRNGRYSIDFDDLERRASRPKVTLLLFCNPHNPSGRVWTPEELTRVADICMRHNVFMVSDEIHCELTFGNHRYTPFGSLSPEISHNSVSCVSPSKAFNIAGLQIANIITANDPVRRRIDRAININEVCDVNPFGVEATIAAYKHGSEWLEALKDYIWGNYQLLLSEFSNRLPQINILPLEGTYLAWIDISSTHRTSEEITLQLLKQEHLMINSGTMYGPGGEGFLRLNLACPRAILADAINRMIDTLTNLR